MRGIANTIRKAGKGKSGIVGPGLRTANLAVLREVLALPTAPFAEHHVIRYIESFCARCGVQISRDLAGNVLVRVRTGGRRVKRPLCFTAHLDHPGFVADRMVSRKRLRAYWRGHVAEEYFSGSAVRFYVEGSWVLGRVSSYKVAERAGRKRVDTVVIEVGDPVPPKSIGMWDFPDPVVRGSKIHARACDDLAGASALLCTIDVLTKTRRPCDVYFLFTRAEEVGFIGAMAACRLRTIPRDSVVVAMETSAVRSNARQGDGPILRVGDRASTFTPAATSYGHRIAGELALRDKSFKYQRKLMDGGTCESSAFCALGYDATGVCVALGNYHNVDAKKRRLAMEYVDLNDFDNMVKWFVAMATDPVPYTGRDDVLAKQLTELTRAYDRLLKQTPISPA